MFRHALRWGGGDFQNWSRGGGRCLTIDVAHLLPTPFGDRMTNTCEHMTFSRFAMRPVINWKYFVIFIEHLKKTKGTVFTDVCFR